MRTTVIIDDSLQARLKGLASKRGLSDFINQCLHEHFERQERRRRLKALEKSYQRAAKGEKGSPDFEATDNEEWPEW